MEWLPAEADLKTSFIDPTALIIGKLLLDVDSYISRRC
jgi:hypothetical protein